MTAPAVGRPYRPDQPSKRAWGQDRGSESVELAILLPVILLVLAFLVVGARIALAGDRITGVAGAAAREASLARTPAEADNAARQAAVAALESAGLHCTRVTVDTDTSGFSNPAGLPGTVTVDVWCTVDLSDVGAPGLPGAKTLHDQAISPVDTARSRP